MNLSILSSEKIKKKSKIKAVDLFFVITAMLATIFAIKFFPIILVALIGLIMIWYFTNNIHHSIYLLIITGFFHGLVINVSSIPIINQISVSANIDAPLIDFVAIIIGLSLLLAIVLNKVQGESRHWRERGYSGVTIKKNDFKHIKPGIFIYLAFLLSGVIAVTFFMFNDYTQIGIKYLFRPMLFLFLFYFVLPYLLLKKNTTQYLSIIKTMFWLALAIAIFGLSSVFFVKQMGWARIVPYKIFGVTPLGLNHNQLAEVLVALLPSGWYLYAYARYKKHKEDAGLYAVAALFITAIAALTLSRAAWVSMSVQFIIVAFYLIRFRWFKTFLYDKSAFLAVLFLPIIGYMTFFLGSSIVTSSNIARIDAAAIAFHYSSTSPWFGQGPGSFIYILADTALFRAEYGDPLDSHGFLLKLLLENGLIGLILFSGFLLWVMGYVSNSFLHTKDRALILMLLASVAGIVTFQLFDTSYYSSIMWLPLGIAAGMATGVRRFKF